MKKNKPIRLEKKMTFVEKVKKWFNEYKILIAIIFGTIMTILMVILILMFMPGTESGVWYNGGIENAIQ